MQHTSFSPWHIMLLAAFVTPTSQSHATPLSTSFMPTPNEKFLFNGIDYFQGSWEETLQAASVKQQIVFVEIFAENYVPSRLVGDLLAVPVVSDYYNNNFVNYRVNINSFIGKEFMKKYNVKSAGELLFFDHQGRLLLRENGATDTKKLLAMGQTINKQNNLDVMQAEYNKGVRKTNLLYNYAYQLRINNRPHDQVVDEYIQKEKLTKRKCNDKEDIKFVYDFASNLRTDAMDVLLSNKSTFEQQYGTDKVEQKIEKAIITAANYAVEAQDEKMLQRACEIAERNHAPNKADMVFDMQWKYYDSVKDRKNQIRIVQQYMKQYKGQNATIFHQKAVALLQVAGSEQQLWQEAQQWLEQSTQLMPNYYNQKDYARLLMHLGDYAAAKQMAQKAIAIAQSNGTDYAEAQHIIEIITTPTMKGSVRL